MIKLTKVKNESRKRDIKRKRLLLRIGSYRFHLSQNESKYLLKSLRQLVK